MDPQYAYQSAPANFMPMMMAGGGLAAAAQHLQNKGRNGDSMLVHMTPGEVGGLQALAMAHGGSMSVNPQTGLPEANFLKNLLPTILGAGLTFFSGGAINPLTAGAIVGGFEGVRTGNLGKGIMAGLGAFGGAGLGASLAGASSVGAQAAGTQAMQSEAANQAANIMQAQAQPAAMGNLAAGQSFYGANLTPGDIANVPGFNTAAIEQARQSAVQDFAKQGLGSQLKGSYATLGQPGGISDLSSNLMTQYGGKYGAMAAATPTLMGVSEALAPKTSFPTTPVEKSNYAGPYVPSDRQVRFKRPDDESTSEFTFFTPSNPVPGYQPYYAAEGGSVPKGDDALDEYQELAVGGLTALASGRYLQGAGDGTSDSIPATIGAKQPARLADGEFVIDARTVSEIGNGSSNAGAKKLYAMMDRVHKARKKAGRGQDSKAERYLPA